MFYTFYLNYGDRKLGGAYPIARRGVGAHGLLELIDPASVSFTL